VLRFAVSTAASLVFPFAPHAGADAYELLTGERVWETPWPVADPRYLQRDVIEVVCQVNGKLRDRVQVAAGTDAEQLKQLCRAAPKVSAHIDGHEVLKEIVVPGKLVNFVVR
jgi:leucyl-tRNA synthetase